MAVTSCKDGGTLVPDVALKIGSMPVQSISGMDFFGSVYAASGSAIACLSINGGCNSTRSLGDPIVALEALGTSVLAVTSRAALLVKAGSMETERVLLADGRLDEAGKPQRYIMSAVIAPNTRTLVLGLSDGTVGVVGFG